MHACGLWDRPTLNGIVFIFETTQQHIQDDSCDIVASAGKTILGNLNYFLRTSFRLPPFRSPLFWKKVQGTFYIPFKLRKYMIVERSLIWQIRGMLHSFEILNRELFAWQHASCVQDLLLQ